MILGKSGMLGSRFVEYFGRSADSELYAFDSKELDVCDFKKVEEKLKNLAPDFVINCAAYTAVDEAESHADEAFKINGDAVGQIAKYCKEIGVTLIHFSTDYVFDGENPDGYDEDDVTSPINVYGASKLKGEQLIASNTEKFYIIRTSWLFGAGGKNFVDTMLKLAGERSELSLVSDQIGSPTYTVDLCRAVAENFLSSTAQTASVLPFGIYHLTNSGTTSWYGFAKKIFELESLSIKLNRTDSTAFVRPAKRPHCSVLKSSKIDFGMRNWEEALKEYLA